MPLVRGPSDPDAFRVSRYGARWYKDTLPADGRWSEMGEPVPAVTTIKKAWNKPFRKRTETGLVVPLDAYRAAQYVSDNLRHLSQMHPSEAFTLVATAPERDLAKAAQRGTGVHSVIEAMAMGQVIAPELHDDDVRPFLPACQLFVDEWQPVWHMAEFIVIERTLGFAGTADALVELPGMCPTCGEPFGMTLVDWKSRGSAHGTYPEEVCQIGGYSLGEYIIVQDDQGKPVRRDPPHVDHGAIVSITADDGYRLYPVEIDAARQAFLGLFETWRLRRDGESIARKGVGLPVGPPNHSLVLASDDVDSSEGGEQPSDQDARNGGHDADTSIAGPPPSGSGDNQVACRENQRSHLDDLPVDITDGFVVDLTQWLRSRVVAIAGAGRPLPLSWPRGVPTFKSGEAIDLDGLVAIEQWCDDTEMILGMPFPSSRPCEPDPEPDESQLPEPAPRGPTAREQATEWADKGRALLSLLDDDLGRAAAAVAQCDDVMMTRVRYLVLAAVVTQVSTPGGVLVARWSGSGVSIEAHPDIAVVLLAMMPAQPDEDGNVPETIRKNTRGEALKRGKRVAKKLGVPSPRSYEELCADLMLAACVAAGHGLA